MADIELTFDEVFTSFGQSSQQDPTNHTEPLTSPMSPLLPKAPNSTTTVTPVMTPAVIKAPWNFSETLQEAFPDAEFTHTESDGAMTLHDWIRLNNFESPSEDYRLAVLIHDRLPFLDEEADEQYLMSGALPNDVEDEVSIPKSEVKSGTVKHGGKDDGKDDSKNEGSENGKKEGTEDDKKEGKNKNKKKVEESKEKDTDESNDEGKNESKNETKNTGEESKEPSKQEEKDTDTGKENTTSLSDYDYSEDSDDAYGSDYFDDTPYRPGMRTGW